MLPAAEALAAGAALLLAGWVTRVHRGRRGAPPLAMAADAPTAAGEAPPEVTILLPVRNEALNVEACLDGLLAQTARPWLRVVDDASTDGTVDLVAARLAGHERAVWLRARPLPEGWRGKVNGLWSGYQGVASPWVLMTDADTRHQPELLARALATARERGLDSVSIGGFQAAVGVGENLLIPPVFVLLDGLLGDWQSAAAGRTAVANGQYFLLRREALDAIGGLEGIRSAALDDVALGAKLHAAGFRHGFFRAPELLTTRMYRGPREAFHGWRRIFGTLTAGPPRWVSGLAAYGALVLVAFLAAGGAGSVPAALGLWASGALLSAAARASGGHSPAHGLLFPLDLLTLTACVLAAARDARRGELASWKGRAMVVTPPEPPSDGA